MTDAVGVDWLLPQIERPRTCAAKLMVSRSFEPVTRQICACSSTGSEIRAFVPRNRICVAASSQARQTEYPIRKPFSQGMNQSLRRTCTSSAPSQGCTKHDIAAQSHQCTVAFGSGIVLQVQTLSSLVQGLIQIGLWPILEFMMMRPDKIPAWK